MIPLIVTDSVRKAIAPELSEADAWQAVIADLADGWTLAPTSAGLRGRAGSQQVVDLSGRSFSYLANLRDYELPQGWCICSGSGPCHCREPRPEQSRLVQTGQGVVLTKCSRLSKGSRVALSGDRYHEPFFLVGSGRAPSGQLDPRWHEALAERWTRVHARVRRPPPDVGIVGQWGRALKLRRLVANSLARAVPYRGVELDEEGFLVFALSDPDAAVSLDAVYQLPGAEKLELRVVDHEGGQLRCESQSDPTAVLDFANDRRGNHRSLVLDQKATNSILNREEYTMSDLRRGRASNPTLLELLADPQAAHHDAWLPIREEPLQPKLNDGQLRAVQRALRARELIVIQGPPGTGKTDFISELIMRHLQMHPADRVLVASQTHQATDNLLRRTHKLDGELPIVRVAGPAQEAKIAEDILPFWLDATVPWRDGVVDRAERYGRYIQAQVLAGELDEQETAQLLEVQNEYLDTDGLQPPRARRLAEARIIAGTCFEVSRDQEVREGKYSLAILEEAGKASATEALMAMLRAEKTVLVGDTRQLPPMPDQELIKVLRQAAKDPSAIANKTLRAPAVELAGELQEARLRLQRKRYEAPEEFVEETLFSYLARSLPQELVVELTTQYRMVSGIGDLISSRFYGGLLEHGRSDETREARTSGFSSQHVQFIDIAGRELQPRGSNSRLNRAEAQRAGRLLLRLNKDVARSRQAAEEKPLEVALITGYLAQLRELNKVVAGLELPQLKVRVGLVDRFQGDEAEIVIFSLVRTERAGFLRERNRVNVALSRARSLLIILGDLEAARAGVLAAPMREVVRYIDERVEAHDKRFRIEARQQPKSKRQAKP